MEAKTVKDIEATLIREAAAILRKDPAVIDAEAPLPELGFDSMGFVELLVVIEKKFNLRLMESGLAAEDFKTIRTLAARVGKGTPA